MKNLYNILGVSKSATDAELKSAYRKLARKYHPDVNQDNKDAADKFKEVSGAYDVLGDKEKRKKYDNNEIDADGKPTGFGAGGFGSGFGGEQQYSGNPFGGGFGGQSAEFDLNDIFSSVFGGGFGGQTNPQQRRRTPQKGQDINYTLTIDFLSAIKGDEKAIIINGKKVNVKIPKESINGQTLRLKELGEPSFSGGKNGDVLITLDVLKDKYFSLDGSNIILDLPISIKEALLGAKVTAPIVNGKVNLNIPPLSSSGDKLRLKGKGIKGGDQIVILKIISPKTKNKQLENALDNIDNYVVRDF
ncbi:MAG: J domain-containing protein [Alphaproteobacteria bacterium]